MNENEKASELLLFTNIIYIIAIIGISIRFIYTMCNIPSNVDLLTILLPSLYTLTIYVIIATAIKVFFVAFAELVNIAHNILNKMDE